MKFSNKRRSKGDIVPRLKVLDQEWGRDIFIAMSPEKKKKRKGTAL